MSQREVLLLLAHVQFCAACRRRLFADPDAVFTGRALTSAEKETLKKISDDDFLTPDLLARAAGAAAAELDEYKDHPIARLRHL